MHSWAECGKARGDTQSASQVHKQHDLRDGWLDEVDNSALVCLPGEWGL